MQTNMAKEVRAADLDLPMRSLCACSEHVKRPRGAHQSRLAAPDVRDRAVVRCEFQVSAASGDILPSLW
jgi:hypothetical protein